MMRDTVSIPGKGFILIRFIADNPGVWFFHCHIDLHLVGGMGSTIIEAPDILQAEHSIPDMGMYLCQRQGRWSSGNCAGQDGWITDAYADQCNTVWNVGSATDNATTSVDGQDGSQESKENNQGSSFTKSGNKHGSRKYRAG